MFGRPPPTSDYFFQKPKRTFMMPVDSFCQCRTDRRIFSRYSMVSEWVAVGSSNCVGTLAGPRCQERESGILRYVLRVHTEFEIEFDQSRAYFPT